MNKIIYIGWFLDQESINKLNFLIKCYAPNTPHYEEVCHPYSDTEWRKLDPYHVTLSFKNIDPYELQRYLVNPMVFIKTTHLLSSEDGKLVAIKCKYHFNNKWYDCHITVGCSIEHKPVEANSLPIVCEVGLLDLVGHFGYKLSDNHIYIVNPQ